MRLLNRFSEMPRSRPDQAAPVSEDDRIRHSRIVIADLLWGWTPHETQRQWLQCGAAVKVAACGRRWGKTEAAAIDAAVKAIGTGNIKQMIVSPTYDQSRLIFDTVERLMLSHPITRRMTKVVRTPYPRLMLSNNSVIMARTADEDGRNLRGHSADRVIVDEAAYVRDSVIAEVISPMLADKNGQLVMVSTPFGKNHFYRAFLRGQDESDKRFASFCFPSESNPHISREYIEDQRRVLSRRQFAVEYEAEFIDEQSCVFAWDDIKAAIDTGAELKTGESCIVAGVDWARYSDYTALVAIEVRESGMRVIGLDRFNGIGWNMQVERVVEFLIEHRVSAVLTDRTSIGDPLLEQLRNRMWERCADVAVEGYTFTNSSKRELVEHLALKFARRAIAVPDDDELIKELQYFEYELTQSGNVRMNARSGYHDDLVIALALACWQGRSVGISGPVLAGGGRAAPAGW